MPFRVVNRSPRRRPPALPHKISVNTTYGVYKSAPPMPDDASVYSDASSDNGTLHTVYSDVSNKKGVPASYGLDKASLTKSRLSDEYDPYATENLDHASSSSCGRTLLGTVHQLASALGPDNILQTTEIDTIPCAGVRIPHGPLKGLLAWRLVVRIPDRAKSDDWWKGSDDQITPDTRRRVHSMRPLCRPPATRSHSASHSISGHTKLIDDSLPFGRRSFPSLQDTFSPPPPQRKPIALVSNFILDTSIPHSVISREALGALGYPLSRLPKNPRFDYIEDHSVMLSIQGVPTRLSIANHGEASRLGVQFLHDAGVSVFFPQNGDGIGPVLYLESAQLMKNVPSTLPGGRARERKNTLPRRVRALLGLSS